MADRQRNRLGDRSGLGHDLEARATIEHRREALPHGLVVIDHEDTQASLRRLAGHRSIPRCTLIGGTVTMIRVPPPGRLSTTNEPPSASARARMLARP